MKLRHISQRIIQGLSVPLLKWQYRNRPYSDYYAALMRKKTASNPQTAVGGMWEELGRLQFEFLLKEGLKKEHHLLDFGCGSLRGGLHFIDYLQSGHYTGVDISEEILEAGKAYLRAEGLEDKKPLLLVNRDLTLASLQGNTFDYILAQSVLTHMPEEDIHTLFRHIPALMTDESLFYATFHEGRKAFTPDFRNFYYPLSFFKEAARDAGLELQHLPSFHHPRKQQMLRLRLKQG